MMFNTNHLLCFAGEMDLVLRMQHTNHKLFMDPTYGSSSVYATHPQHHYPYQMNLNSPYVAAMVHQSYVGRLASHNGFPEAHSHKHATLFRKYQSHCQSQIKNGTSVDPLSRVSVNSDACLKPTNLDDLNSNKDNSQYAWQYHNMKAAHDYSDEWHSTYFPPTSDGMDSVTKVTQQTPFSVYKERTEHAKTEHWCSSLSPLCMDKLPKRSPPPLIPLPESQCLDQQKFQSSPQNHLSYSHQQQLRTSPQKFQTLPQQHPHPKLKASPLLPSPLHQSHSHHQPQHQLPSHPNSSPRPRSQSPLSSQPPTLPAYILNFFQSVADLSRFYNCSVNNLSMPVSELSIPFGDGIVVRIKRTELDKNFSTGYLTSNICHLYTQIHPFLPLLFQSPKFSILVGSFCDWYVEEAGKLTSCYENESIDDLKVKRLAFMQRVLMELDMYRVNAEKDLGVSFPHVSTADKYLDKYQQPDSYMNGKVKTKKLENKDHSVSSSPASSCPPNGHTSSSVGYTNEFLVKAYGNNKGFAEIDGLLRQPVFHEPSAIPLYKQNPEQATNSLHPKMRAKRGNGNKQRCPKSKRVPAAKKRRLTVNKPAPNEDQIVNGPGNNGVKQEETLLSIPCAADLQEDLGYTAKARSGGDMKTYSDMSQSLKKTSSQQHEETFKPRVPAGNIGEGPFNKVSVHSLDEAGEKEAKELIAAIGLLPETARIMVLRRRIKKGVRKLRLKEQETAA